MKLSSIEGTCIAFLIIFTVLLVPATYVWSKYMRAGYPWRYGFWGAFLVCISRIADFIAELVFFGSNYKNFSAIIAFVVTLSIGFIGLLECESALFVTWAETHIGFGPKLQQIHGKLRLLNIVGIVLVIYGATQTKSKGAISSTGAACTQAGTIIFLVLTVLQSGFIAYGWKKYGKMSETLAVLTVTVMALYVRIIWGVYTTFHRSVSIINFSTSNVKYLIGPILIPETVALILMIALGIHTVRNAKLPDRRPNNSERYDTVALEAHKNRHTHGVHRG